MRRYEKIPLATSFILNLVAIVIKYFVYTSTLSRTVLAEVFHSAGDVINSFTLYQGSVYSTKPPSLRYPFGRGRFAYVASLISSVLLAGSVFYMIVIEGFMNPPTNISVASWRPYTWYIAIIIIFDLATLIISLLIYKKVSVSGRTLLKPLLLEDLLGLSGNFIAITSLYISDPEIDLVLSVIVAIVIIVSASHVVYENVGILVGVSAPREILWRIVKSVISIPEVLDVNDIKSLMLEPGEYIVILQIEIDPSTSMEDAVRVKEEIAELIKKIDPSIRYVIIDLVKPQEPKLSYVRILREIRDLKE
ncbi:MAG: cation diffusion facilitator family transporter [Sulfolobales archaeon]